LISIAHAFVVKDETCRNDSNYPKQALFNRSKCE